MPGWVSWRNFWIFWIGGLLVFGILVATGDILQTGVAPGGILDHQAAGTADRVDAIQQSWAEAGVLSQARLGMIGDLIFISLYMIGGIIGGRLIWQYGRSPTLKKLGLLLVISYFIFGLSDYVETISQFIQLLQMQGSDALAGVAAIFRPIKVAAFIVGTLVMISALIWHRVERRA
ncbi:hypothetical protein MNBD_ALPHA04-1469 [hydrothermal vent metagenome]|uniref:Uncharacterized protein n=1 Tax=hydrothermal vent metagenome TaxID=652676 RepID=A0A3B0S7R3_9ZZZZ